MIFFISLIMQKMESKVFFTKSLFLPNEAKEIPELLKRFVLLYSQVWKAELLPINTEFSIFLF